MAISIIGTPAATAATSITLPTHASGDLLVIFAWRNDGDTVAIPSAGGSVPNWVDIEHQGGNNCHLRVATATATGSTHTSGTWTNATGLSAIVLRGQGGVGRHNVTGSAVSEASQVTGVSITPSVTDGSSLLLYAYAHVNVTAWSAAPAGYTRQASSAGQIALNTKNSSTSDGAQTQSCTTSASGRSRAAVVEIMATPNMGSTIPAAEATADGIATSTTISPSAVAAPPDATAESSLSRFSPTVVTVAAAATADASAPTVGTGGSFAGPVTAVPAESTTTDLFFAIDAEVVADAAAAIASAVEPALQGLQLRLIVAEAAHATAAAIAPAVAGTIVAPLPAAAAFRIVVEAAFGSDPDEPHPHWTVIKDTADVIEADYNATVLEDAPRGYWQLDETSGDFADTAGGDHTATAVGGITYSQPGAVDTGVVLNGTTGYLQVADHTDFATGDTFSLEAWLTRSGPVLATQVLFEKGTGSYRFELDTNEQLFLWCLGSGAVVRSSTIVPDDGEPHHIVVTKDGGACRLYIDSADVTVGIANQTFQNNTTNIGIGASPGGTGLFLDGGLDEVAIYSTVLSPARVVAHYTARSSVGAAPKYVRAMTWRRGRQMPLERVETGTGALVLRNGDRRWDPKKHPEVRPMLPIRAYAVTESGRELPMFHHNADGFPRRHVAPTYAEVSLSTVDAMEGLALARVPPERATFTTSFSGINNDLTFTAWQPGAQGNDITITITETKFHPLRQQRVVVTVQGSKINVDYIDKDQGAGTTTVEMREIKAAIEAVPAAAKLVECTYPPGNDGTGSVIRMNLPETHLAGGDVSLFPSELGGARINRLLDFANWPAGKRLISAGQDLHGVIAFPTDAPAMLSHIQDIVSVASENGLLYVDGDRNMVFLDRFEKLTAPRDVAQMVFSDRPVSGGGGYGSGGYGAPVYGESGSGTTTEWKYVDLVPTHGKDRVINDVTGSRPGGDDQGAYDPDSAQRNRRRSQSFTSTLASDAQVQSALEMIVAEYGEPQERIELMVVMPGKDYEYWERLLELDVGSRVTIKEHPVNGDPVEEADYIIQGLQGEVPEDWVASRFTFQLWPAEPIANWWVWDESTWDGGDRWGR